MVRPGRNIGRSAVEPVHAASNNPREIQGPAVRRRTISREGMDHDPPSMAMRMDVGKAGD